MRKFYSLVISLIVTSLVLSVSAQERNFWSSVDESSVPGLYAGGGRPTAFKLFRLQTTGFRAAINLAPSENAVTARNSSFRITLPYKNGELMSFSVVDAPVMAPGLAARYPGIHSYAGVSTTDATVRLRFSVSPQGVNASIMSPGSPTVYIDPVTRDRNTEVYQVVDRNALPPQDAPFTCSTHDILNPLSDPATARGNSADDGQLRKFRLALCATGAFSQFFLDGTETTDAERKAKVLAAQNVIMTRANAIFENEFAVRLVLVETNDAVIYLDAANDPWGDLNSATQLTCDANIGSANYDIGHVIDRGPDNGNAGCIGCVCVAGQKGSGFTSYTNLGNTDLFVVDYMTHEMGHQLGANHTFSFNYEGSIAQTEPGSGSTIMGYAGITNADVQPHSDDYFHSISIQQVTNYIRTGTGSSCASLTATGNAAPTANAGADYTIPISTPFTLTGTGTDANSTDVLTYDWEQNDRRLSSYPVFPTVNSPSGPQFRSYPPTAGPTRTFPQLSSILDGSNTNTWEKLPSVNRLLNFRFTTRDNRLGGASNAEDDMTVTTTATSGPFQVTTENTAVNWEGASSQTVTWNVAGTTGAPVSCANVNILLSTDGGLTFPTTLVANTPNDGTETIVVPDNPTTSARIKVQSVGNIFFDINNVNFTIIQATIGFNFTSPAATTVACAGPTSATVTLGTTAIGGWTTPIVLTSTGAPAGTTVSFAPSTINPGQNTVVTLSNTNTLAFGSYTITVTGTSGSVIKTRDLVFTVQPGTAPTITANPQPVTTCEQTAASFSVNAPGATAYQWSVRTTPTGTFTPIADATTSTFMIASVSATQNGYAYQVAVTGQCGVSTSTAAVLTVQNKPVITSQPQSATLCLGSNATFTVAATGTSLTYLWQTSTDGTTYTTASGTNNAASYTVSNIQVSMNNTRYRVVVSGTCSPASTSTAAVLTVVSPAAVAANGDPVDQVICETGNVTFTVTAGTSGVFYRWQVSTNNGSSYTDLADGGVYSGTATATLMLSNVTPSLNNNLYRVGLYNSTCTAPVFSAGASLTVNARPTVTLSASPSTTLLPGQTTTITADIVPSAVGFDITWFRNDVVIPGVNGTTYPVTVEQIGNYKVGIVNQVTGCNNESPVLAITTTASSRLFVFPIPNNGNFTVSYYNSAGTSTMQTLSVFDSKGALVLSRAIPVSGLYTLTPVSMGGAAKGVYYLVIGDAAGKKITDTRMIVH